MAIGEISSARASSANVLSYELDAANSKGAGWGTLGDLLGGAGSIMTKSGISKAAAAAPVGTSPLSLLFGSYGGAPAMTRAGTIVPAADVLPTSLGSIY